MGNQVSVAPRKRSSSRGSYNDNPLPLPDDFHYEKGSCALEYWEPIRLLREGSISDIHLVRRRKHRIRVRYKEKRDIMKFAKSVADNSDQDDIDENELFVLKSIMKDYVRKDSVLEEMRNELYTMSYLKHPNIVTLYEAYERRRHLYLVMEYCPGGDLADRHFTETESASIVQRVLSAVDYMHANNVVHRDLKLENIMLDAKGEIKIIDFGLATKYLSDDYKVMTDKVGTLYSMAPQVLQGVYTFKCDLWSIGVITYELLCGNKPFWGPNRSMPWSQRRKVIIDRIMRCKYTPMYGPSWANTSQEAKDFVASLLRIDPDERPTARQAMQSPWIHRHLDARNARFDRNKEVRLLHQIKQKALKTLARRLTAEEIAELKEECEVNDAVGADRLNLSSFRKMLEKKPCLSTEEVASIFDNEESLGLDTNATIEYVDFFANVLKFQGRESTESVAETLDELDVAGTRKLPKETVESVLRKQLSAELFEALWCVIETDSNNQVSSVNVLESLDKLLAKNLRDSIRCSRNEQSQEMNLANETNTAIPGGRLEGGRQPKYIYDSHRKAITSA